MTLPISALDVSQSVVEAEACYLAAAARTHSPSDRIAFLLDAHLIRNQVPVSTNDDYPGFAAWVAAREADNRRAREAK